jgi:hypothetical protein
MHSESVVNVLDAFPDFPDQVVVKLRMFKEGKSVRCLVLALHYVLELRRDFIDTAFTNTEMLDALVDKCCTLDIESGSHVANCLRLFGEVDPVKCRTSGLLTKIIDRLNNIDVDEGKHHMVANLASALITIVGKVPECVKGYQTMITNCNVISSLVPFYMEKESIIPVKPSPGEILESFALWNGTPNK